MELKDQVQGVVLGLFGAYAGAHLADLTAQAEAGNPVALVEGLVNLQPVLLGADLNDDATWVDLILGHMGIASTSAAYDAAADWANGELAAGATRAEVIIAAVTYLLGDTVEAQYADVAAAFQADVAAGIEWSEGDGADVLGIADLRAEAGNVVVFNLTNSATPDTIIGTSDNNTITGEVGTYAATDIILDQSTTDNDVLSIKNTGALTFGAVQNIETINVENDGNVDFAGRVTGAKNVNVTIASTTASHTVDADGLKGVTLTVDRVEKIPSGVLFLNGGTQVQVDALETNLVAGAVVTGLTANLVNNDKTAVSINAGTADLSVTAIDKAGVTVVAGKDVAINLAAVATTATKASVSASGEVDLDAGKATASVDVLTLSGNGAAVEYTVTTSTGTVEEFVITGAQDVALVGDAAEFNGTTLTNNATGSTTLKVETAAALDLSDWDLINNVTLAASFDGAAPASQVVTVNSGSTVTLASDQAKLVVEAATDAAITSKTLNLVVADDGVEDDANTEATVQLSIGAAELTGFKTVTIAASDDALVATSLNAGTANLSLSGTAAFALGDVTAASVASTGTGAVKLTYKSAGSIATAGGKDDITLNAASEIQSVATGDGDDKVAVIATGVGTLVNTGAGNDEVSITSTNALVIEAGAGNDKITLNANGVDADIRGGEGADELIVSASGTTVNVSAATNFTTSSIEKVTLADSFTVSVAQFDTFKTAELAGTAAKVLTVTAAGATTAQNIDASGLEIKLGTTTTTALIGGSGNDTIIGSITADVITGGAGNDTLTGGLGNDTFVFSTTAALNGSDTITDFLVGTNIIDFAFGETGGLAKADLRGTGAGYEELGAGGTVAADTGLINYTAAVANFDSATILAAANGLDGGGTGGVFTSGDIVYFAVSNGTNSAIFKLSDAAGTDGVLDAAELVVTLTGVNLAQLTGLSAANFADFS